MVNYIAITYINFTTGQNGINIVGSRLKYFAYANYITEKHNRKNFNENKCLINFDKHFKLQHFFLCLGNHNLNIK